MSHDPRPTTPLPCDRCLDVQPLRRHGQDLLCSACHPDTAKEGT